MERDRNRSAGNEAGPENYTAGTAVVPFGQVRTAQGATSSSIRPGAAFIAQLIAANENMPQFRIFRRNDPFSASAVYQSAAGRTQRNNRPSGHQLTSITA